QLMNGPYSQLRALRTSATGLSGGSSPASFADSARAARQGSRAAAIRTDKKNFALELNFFPSCLSVLHFSQERPTHRSAPWTRLLEQAQPATCSICSAVISKFE